MKQLSLILFSFCFILNVSAQKLVFTEVGFKLKDNERELIEKLAGYEVKIYNGLFNNTINDSLVINVNLYNKFKNFKELLKERDIKGFTESGFYSPREKRLYVFYQGKGEINTLLHEISHALMHNNLKRPPRWFNEGVAEFLESLRENNGRIEVYTQHHYLNYVRDLNKEGKIDIFDFVQHQQSGWRQKDRLRYMYAVSYSIIYLLIKKDSKIISKMAMLMKQNKSKESIFNECFKGGFDGFQGMYRIFYR